MPNHRCILLLLATAGCGTATQPPSGSFLALSYNVAGLVEGLSGSHPETNIPIMSPLLNGYDLVLVQEDFFYHRELARDTDHPHRSRPGKDIALVNDGLNRFSRIPFGELTRVPWEGCFGGIDTSDGGAGDCLARKGFSAARTTLAPGVEVDIYNLHAEAGGTAEDDRLRIADFVQLAAHINANSAGQALIIGGDTNVHVDDPVDAPIFYDFLAATGVVDVCHHRACGEERIDRFFFRSNGALSIEPMSWRFENDLFVDPQGEDLSDHQPLAVRFDWRANAAGR